jgi:uncharacterized protein (TIGR02271 family)
MPTKTQSTVVAVFRNRSDAEAAASDLKANGFGPNDVYISSDTSAVDATTQAGGAYSDTADRPHHEHEGGIVGWFKSVFGHEDDGDRTYYEEAVNSGHTFLSVDVTDQNVDRVADVLNGHNPVDIHREEGSGQMRSGDPLAAAPPTGAVPAYGAGTAANTGSGRTAGATGTTGVRDGEAIPVVREELKVGKRAVLKGGVRVYSRVVDEPVEESVRLRQEQVRVDRTPVNREATAADLRPGNEQVFEVKEYSEEPVVSKQARVVEEVRIRKEATERTETVRENVRHTEVNVENVAGGNASASGTGARTAASTAGRTTTEASGPTSVAGSPAYPNTGAASASAGTGLGVNDEDFRRHYQSTYGSAGDSYDTYRPGYHYGYQMANDPRYKGRSWDDVESDLRSDYGQRYPNSTWDRMKGSVRYGWNKVTGKV